MNSKLIYDLALERLKSLAVLPKSRIAINNVNFDTPSDGIWCELFIQNGVNIMAGMSSEPCTRELGAVLIEIRCPNNSDTRVAMSMADAIGRHFQYYRVGKLELMTASVINVPERSDGYKLNVRIPYRFN